MAKIATLLLVGCVVTAVGPVPRAAAGEALIMAQQQSAPETSDKEKQKAQPKPLAPKGQPLPPAARGQPPVGQPPAAPAAKGQPPAGQPQHTQAPAGPAVEPTKPQRPAQGLPPPASQPPAAQGQPPVPGQPPRPSTAQPAQPQPAGHPPAAQGRPGQPQPPAAQGQPVQPQPPAAQGRPVQPPPPAAQGQPVQPQPPAAQGRPVQPPPPAAQGQPYQQPPPAAQGKPVQQPGQLFAPAPAAQGQPQPPAAQAQRPASALQVPVRPPAQPAVTASGSISPQPTGAQGQPLRRVEEIRSERREVREGDKLVIREPDRVIIQEGGTTFIRHDETNRFLMSGREVAVDRRGGETTTIVERPDGTRIVTVTDDDGRLIRRVRRLADGREIVIIDNPVRPGGAFLVTLGPPIVRIPPERYIVEVDRATPEIIYETLIAPPVERIGRRYTLDEVLYSEPLRERMPRIDIDTITFDTGSWEITPDQVARLAVIAEPINRAIARNPGEVFLVEGHTDAVGSDVDNLSLSDRRAESVALALTERFQVPAESLTTQGYGKQFLKIPTQAAERQNRRVTLRRITPLLTGSQSTGQAN